MKYIEQKQEQNIQVLLERYIKKIKRVKRVIVISIIWIMVIKHQMKIIIIRAGRKLMAGIYTIFGNDNFNF